MKAGVQVSLEPKLYTPSTLNIDLILWHTQFIVCAMNVNSWFRSQIISFTFQAYTLPYMYMELYIRVANVVADHNDLLTQ